MAAAEVAALAEMMGHLLDLPAWRLKRLRLAGLLHHIAMSGVQYGSAVAWAGSAGVCERATIINPKLSGGTAVVSQLG